VKNDLSLESQYACKSIKSKICEKYKE